MKKRIFNVLNFLALNVLFFAVYLNFIHKDINVLPAAAAARPAHVASKNLATPELPKNQVAAVKPKPKLNAAEN